mgnify:CR=1 FL=1
MYSKKKYAIIIVTLLILFISFKFNQSKSSASVSTAKIFSESSIEVENSTIEVKTTSPLVKKKVTPAIAKNSNVLAIESVALIKPFKCDIAPDQDMVKQVQQTLDSYSHIKPLNIKKHKIDNTLSIRVFSQDLPINFSENIDKKLWLILEFYEDWFSLKLKNKMTLNLVVLPSLSGYSDFISTLSIDSTNSQGLFWANTNFAFAAYRNEQQVEQTIIHEVVHALNFYLVGYTARWLTEGLADYFKTINYYIDKDGTYRYHFGLPKLKNQNRPLAISQLIALEEAWDSDQRDHLYSSAFELVEHLIAHKDERNIIRHLLHKEALRPCTKLDTSDYQNLIDENIPNLSTQFE